MLHAADEKHAHAEYTEEPRLELNVVDETFRSLFMSSFSTAAAIVGFLHQLLLAGAKSDALFFVVRASVHQRRRVRGQKHYSQETGSYDVFGLALRPPESLFGLFLSTLYPPPSTHFIRIALTAAECRRKAGPARRRQTGPPADALWYV